MNRRQAITAIVALPFAPRRGVKVPSLMLRPTTKTLEEWDARVYYSGVEKLSELFWRTGPSVDDTILMFDGPYQGRRFLVTDLAAEGSEAKMLYFMREVEVVDERWHQSMRPTVLTEETLKEAIRATRRPSLAPQFVEINGKLLARK